MLRAIDLLPLCESVYGHAAYVAGPKGRDGASYFQSANGDLAIVARGTQRNGWHDKSTVADWMNDLDACHISIPNIKGQVHHGFYRAALDLYCGYIQDVIHKIACNRIYFTGHSKGGAVAEIMAALAKRDFPELDPIVITFAAPRVGDSEFIEHYAPSCTRYEYHADIVPLLPMFGFHGAGQPVLDTHRTLHDRILTVGRLVETMNFQQIIHNHSLEIGYKPWVQ